MKGTIAWLARVVLLPLLPAIVGALVRAVYSGSWNFTAIDSTELGFSVGLIGVVILSSVNRLTDKDLRDSLGPIFIIILALALCLFAGSVLIKVLHEAEQVELLDRLRAMNPLTPDALYQISAPNKFTRISGHIRSATIVLAIISIGIALVARLRYPLED